MLTYATEPTHKDLMQLAQKMRVCDQQEVFAATGESGAVVLIESWKISELAYLLYWNDVPWGACGVAPLTQTIATPWLLCSDHVEEVPNKIFWQLSRAFIEMWHQRYHMLTNYIDVRNTTSRSWLKRLGFEECEEIPYGYSQLPFIRFEKKICAIQPQSLQ